MMNRTTVSLLLSAAAAFLIAALDTGLTNPLEYRPKPKPFEVLLDMSKMKEDFRALDTTDIDSDADEDLILVTSLGAVYAAENKGRGVFEQPHLVTEPITETPQDVVLQFADIDSDNDDDILLTDSSARVYRIIRKASQALSEPERLCEALNAKPGPSLVGVSDIDCDNDVDILVMTSDGAVYSILNKGMGMYADPEKLLSVEGIAPGKMSLALVDLDFDNDEEILVVDTAGSVFEIENTGSGSFKAPKTIGKVANPTSAPVTLAVSDVDWDGDDDLLLILSDGAVYCQIDKGQAIFEEPQRILDPLNEKPGEVRLAISGDDPGYAEDIVVLNSSAVAFSLLDRQKIRFAEAYRISEPFQASTVVRNALLEDINGDGSEDTLVLDDKGAVHVLRSEVVLVVD